MWQSDLGVSATVHSLTGILGQGGYEGIQNDDKGNVYIVEDSGGAAGTAAPHAKQPNSFVYRFLSIDTNDVTKGGVLQALQVINGDRPVTFHAGQADADILGPDTLALRTYGESFTTRWVTVHDTAVDGTAPFNANAAAKTNGATPFKRPENGQFRPDNRFGRSTSTRPATPMRAPKPAPRQGDSAGCSSSRSTTSPAPARCHCSTAATSSTPGSTT